MAETKTTTITTLARRKSLAQITSGAITSLAKITHIALGDGGCDADGEPKDLAGDESALHHEVARYAIDGVTYPEETTARYTATIPAADHAGEVINEIALVDSEGTVCAIKTMYPKRKDGDVIFTFTFDDEF